MSAIDVIEEIKRLPQSEQERVWEYLAKTRARDTAEGAQAKYASDDAFDKAAEKVLNEHDSLFRRLAQ